MLRERRTKKKAGYTEVNALKEEEKKKSIEISLQCPKDRQHHWQGKGGEAHIIRKDRDGIWVLGSLFKKRGENKGRRTLRGNTIRLECSLHRWGMTSERQSNLYVHLQNHLRRNGIEKNILKSQNRSSRRVHRGLEGGIGLNNWLLPTRLTANQF